jgi:hypothetical protein
MKPVWVIQDLEREELPSFMVAVTPAEIKQVSLLDLTSLQMCKPHDSFFVVIGIHAFLKEGTFTFIMLVRKPCPGVTSTVP